MVGKTISPLPYLTNHLFTNNLRMKKLFILLVLAFSLCGCTERKVKNTATDYLQKQMKDPSSFKAEEIDVVLDTIPLYLNHNLLSLGNKAHDALDDVNRYKNRSSSLWYSEQKEASEKLSSTMFEILTSYNELKAKKDKSVHYMVLIKSSGKNSYGGTVSSNYIVIVDKDNTDKVLGEYRVDNDLLEKIVPILTISGEGDRLLKENEFGKIDTEGLTKVEQFIFAD